MASVSKREWTHKGEKKTAWIVRHVDPKGKHCQKTFERKKDADAYRTRMENEAQAFGRDGVTGDCTVKELLDAYSRHYDRRYKDGQIKRGTLKNLLTFDKVARRHLGKMLLSDLDLLAVERFFHALRDEEGLSARTAFERLISLSGAWDFAKRQKMARGDSPVSAAMQHIGTIPKAKIKTFTPTEVQAIIAATDVRRKWQHEHAFHLTRLAVHVAAFCGLRWGEIFALRLCDVDLEKRQIHVRHNLDQWDELVAPKTASSYRTVPIAPQIADAFAAFIATSYQPNDREIIMRGATGRKGQGGGNRIFPAAFVRSYWRPLLEAAGLENPDDYHFHALRHFAGSWWLRNRLPVADVARLLGHADPSITMKIYIHEVMEAEERAAALDTMAIALSTSVAQQLRNGENLLSYQ